MSEGETAWIVWYRGVYDDEEQLKSIHATREGAVEQCEEMASFEGVWNVRTWGGDSPDMSWRRQDGGEGLRLIRYEAIEVWA